VIGRRVSRFLEVIQSMRGNLRLFRLWGIPVEINVSWLVILALMTWTFATSLYPDVLPDATKTELWELGLLSTILLFASILLHEFSHSVVAARGGVPIRKITLFLFGGVAQMERDVDDPTVELKMASAGPLMSVVLAGVFYALARLCIDHRIPYNLFHMLSYINIVILVFNMVPGFPLDGGRILRALIWRRTRNVRKATKFASGVGTVFAYVLMGIGLINVLYRNFVPGLWLIFIGYFVRQAAQSGYLMVTLRRTLGHLRVRDVMRAPVITVDASLDLRHLVDDYFLRYHYRSFPVLRNGVFTGMVSLEDVRKIDIEQWPMSSVEQITDREIARYALHPDFPAETLVQLIMRRGYGRLPVIASDGRVVGIVSRRDLMETIKMETDLEQ
jgi:Zn-dependent protease/predicted transcriptional regulator